MRAPADGWMGGEMTLQPEMHIMQISHLNAQVHDNISNNTVLITSACRANKQVISE